MTIGWQHDEKQHTQDIFGVAVQGDHDVVGVDMLGLLLISHERQRLLQRGRAGERLLLVIAHELGHCTRQRIPVPPVVAAQISQKGDTPDKET